MKYLIEIKIDQQYQNRIILHTDFPIEKLYIQKHRSVYERTTDVEFEKSCECNDMEKFKLIPGIEFLSYNKYHIDLSVAKMFDTENIRKQIEEIFLKDVETYNQKHLLTSEVKS